MVSQDAGPLHGQTALVTGASAGIGKAISAALVASGAWVGMVARGDDPLAAAAEEVGGHAIPADVSVAGQVHHLTTYLAELLGDVPDLIVNSAGAFALSPVAETDPEEFDRQIAVNLRAPFLMIRAFLPHMLARGAGHLISIGSVAGRRALPGNGAYGSAKFGLRGLHEVLAEEIAGSGVRATLVEPAATDTELWDAIDPDNRPELPSRASMLRPEEVAEVVLFAASRPRGVEIPLIAVRSSA